jgi:hypothetical protein
LDGSVSSFKLKENSISRNLISVKSYYSKDILDKLNINIGGTVAIENDTFASAKSIHVYPYLQANYPIDEKNTFFAFIDGGMNKLNYRTRLEQNFFIAPQQHLQHTNRLFDAYLGIEGNQKFNWSYRSKVGMSLIRNLPVFINSNADSAKFITIYDPGRTQRFGFINDFKFQPNKSFSTGLTASYYHYNTDTLSQAWHLPSLELTYNAYYIINEILSLNLEAHYIGNRVAYSPYSGQKVVLKDIIDINFKTNYKISDRFSLYLYFFNILAQKYQIYYLYPVRSINIVGGVWFTF